MSFNLEDLRGPIVSILTAPGIDLGTISAKRVRKELLADTSLGLTARELKERRTEVDKLISDIYESVSRQVQEEESKRKREEEADEGTEQEYQDDSIEGPRTGDEDEDEPPPPKKKKKKSTVDTDAELARKLSSEINSRSRRSASNGSATPKKRKPKKSAKMVDSGDDDEDEEKPKKKRSGGARGGFAKEYILSDSLSVVVGVNKLSRPQVVKKLWEYIHGHELQNPSNKREIMCDDAMRAIFGTEKIDMFRMNKVLGRHLHTE